MDCETFTAIILVVLSTNGSVAKHFIFIGLCALQSQFNLHKVYYHPPVIHFPILFTQLLHHFSSRVRQKVLCVEKSNKCS